MPQPAETQIITSEQILDQLNKLVKVGALQYVLPSIPLGESWVIGHKEQILKFNSYEEISLFLLGASVIAEWFEANHLPTP